jgi:hypothetical protein
MQAAVERYLRQGPVDDDPNNQLWGFVGDDVQGDVDVYFGYVSAIPLGSAVWLPLNDHRRPSAAPVRMSRLKLSVYCNEAF